MSPALIDGNNVFIPQEEKKELHSLGFTIPLYVPS